MSAPTAEAPFGRVDGTAILVNHDSGDRLGSLAEIILHEVPRMVVVDNASTDRSLEPLEDRVGIRILRNQENLGFARAVNRGAREAVGEWLVLVNPDVHPRPGDIRRLVDGLPPDVAAAAPLQVDARGRARPESGGYEPTLLRYLVWALLPARLHRRAGPWLAPPFPSRDTGLDWLSGALLAVRREVFERLGGFDERYFLYHEDVDFGRRTRAAGYRLLLRPHIRLHHEVAHGEPHRRIPYTVRSVESLAADPTFAGWRRRALGLVLGVGFGLRALLARGTTRRRARAALPVCRDLVAGRPPRAGRPAPLV